MRVVSGGGTGPVVRAAGRPAEAGSGFRLESTPGAAATAPAAAARPPQPVATLLALQSVGDAFGGRRRAVRRGRALLDQLDGLKVALLTGRLPAMALERLRGLIAAPEAGDDPEVAEVLAEIELRVEVELAKLERLSPLPA